MPIDQHILQRLQANDKTLTELDLSVNSLTDNHQIGDKGAKALSQNQTLTLLNISYNELDKDAKKLLEQSLAANKKRQVQQRNAFIFRLSQCVLNLDKLVATQVLAFPRELIAHIEAYLDAWFYLRLVDIRHPAHMAKTEQQVYGCALFLLSQQGSIIDNDIVERKSNQQTSYQPFMFKPAIGSSKSEQPAIKKHKLMPPTCAIL